MRCLYCGSDFTPATVIQRYCSARCGERYRRHHTMQEDYPSITFTCAQCGKTVITEPGTKDKRIRFCCASCEKKFWKHPHWENKSTNINFHSVEEYLGYEKRTNSAAERRPITKNGGMECEEEERRTS